MNVEQFFSQLSFGTLSNLNIGLEGIGQIRSEDEDRVVFHTNQVLKSLYSRFTHNRDYVKVQLSDSITKYRIHSDFAVSNTDVGNTNPRYILDTDEEPFTDNLVKILGICTEDDPATTDIDETSQVGINVIPAVNGVTTLSYDSFYVPKPTDGLTLVVEFQALHAPLSIPADKTESIFLAPVLDEALELGVAARIYSSMNGEDHERKANSLMAKYNAVLALVKQEDLLQESFSNGNDLMADKGFV